MSLLIEILLITSIIESLTHNGWKNKGNLPTLVTKTFWLLVRVDPMVEYWYKDPVSSSFHGRLPS